MLRNVCVMLASAILVYPSQVQAASYADSVVAYVPGTAAQGFTNAAAALGEPSRSTPGQFGGPVDPFNPPYLADQVVSIGAGGSLTVGFSTPILNAPGHPFGLDFIIYGNAGFVITNGNYSGGGITDGSLFGANPGTTRVSVSADNINYFQLDPARAPVVDTLFPTDGSGSFDLPVNPQLSQNDFAGLGLAGIRSLYNGSAGGSGFDLAWAQDANGQSVALPEVRFIRVDVLSGVAEIDGVAAPGVVPEPAPWLLLGLGSIVLVLLNRKTRMRL
jgi:hypothetical protein